MVFSGLAAWGSLLGGIGTVLTGITGLILARHAMGRSQKETRTAAEHAAERLLHPGPGDEAVLAAALEIILQQHPPELPEGHHDHQHGGGGSS